MDAAVGEEAGAGGKPGGEAEDAAEATAAGQAERFLEGVCVLEDGTPLAGVDFHAPWKIDDGRSAPIGSSGAGGSFRLKEGERTVRVTHPHARLVQAEGGAVEPSEEGTWPVLTIAGSALRLVFRDRPGTAHVRLVNAETNEPVTDVAGLRMAWHFRGGALTMGVPDDPGLGGWIPIPEGRLPETGGGDRAGVETDPAGVEVELAMPGYERARLPLKDVRGRMQVAVRPVAPDAKGVVLTFHETSPSGGPPAMPKARVSVLGLPADLGSFGLYGLPDGTWEIEVSAIFPGNETRRGRRAFERHGAPVDLGTIELKPAGRVALRVVDSAGEAVPQAWAVVVRPEEDVDQGRRLDLDSGGRAGVGDLEPGVGHRVVVKGLPRDLEQTVVAAADAKPVEFRWPERLVSCRITLLVDGKAVANPDGRTTIPAVVQESPLPRDRGAWRGDGTFEARLVPGAYRFSVLATPREGGDLALFAGEVTVPSGDAFETRLELERSGR